MAVAAAVLQTSMFPERKDRVDPITALGRKAFRLIGEESPSTFDKKYWASRIMEWSIRDPEFKTNMFRLVDVLPNLRTNSAIAAHVHEYLHEPMKRLPGVGWLTRWVLNAPRPSLRSTLLAEAVKMSVGQMANLFIAGSNPTEALPNLRALRAKQLAFTVDLLGEFCVSETEAEEYLNRYLDALDVVSKEAPQWGESAPIVEGHPGDASPICISVKLTALYSQCGPLNYEQSVTILSERLGVIARKAASVGASLYVDAEDCANNPMIYAAFMRVFGSSEFVNFPYPGIVVQAYGKESQATLESLLQFAKRRGAPIAVRLVKGAYWDLETISSQQQGWPSPLFAHKSSTDAHYEHLSRLLIDNREHCMPAFGSHNVRSIAHACVYAEEKGLTPQDFELQMLFGMAEPIARAFVRMGYLVRMYVPLGDMLVGMGYLVRRLLENTSNESFLRHTFFEHDEIAALLRAPEYHPDDLNVD